MLFKIPDSHTSINGCQKWHYMAIYPLGDVENRSVFTFSLQVGYRKYDPVSMLQVFVFQTLQTLSASCSEANFLKKLFFFLFKQLACIAT